MVNDAVSLAKTMRPRISRLTFVFLGLGMCVFAWGLQYKLSLYYPPHSSYHQIPEAKLLSRNEQPGTAAKLRVAGQKDLESDRVHASFIILTWFAALTLFRLPQRGWIAARKKPWLATAQASVAAFLFRPPPVSV